MFMGLKNFVRRFLSMVCFGLLFLVAIPVAISSPIYVPFDAFTDPQTGLQWDDPGYLAFSGCGTLDFIQNSGVHLATLDQLEQLFADIGPYSPIVNQFFGATDMVDGSIATAGFYDAGDGTYGMAYGIYYYNFYTGVVQTSPWNFSSLQPPANQGGDVGLWAVVTPVPEPGTMMLLGAGMAGLTIYGKRRKSCKA
jgi:hypothetical protein